MDELISDMKKVFDCPLIDGSLVTGQSFTSASSTIVQHGLGRVPQGYLVTRQVGEFAQVHETASDANTITFFSNANNTLDFWFF